VVDQAYELRPENPNCSADGRYQIENAPPWTSFDVATGALAGTPLSTDMGTYADVRIFIGDPDRPIVLASFSIDVVASEGSHGLRLSWSPSTMNTDGSVLLDLAGYRIYQGSSPDAFGRPVAVDNPGVTAYVFDSLAPGTHYFAMTAINSDGIESEMSNVYSASLP
jgi:hypothetical protein